MVRRFYTNGYVEELVAPNRYFKTPSQARRFARNSVTGLTANADMTHAEYWRTDEDGVESVETFHNTEYQF